jgi:hypothetical protein
MVVAKYTLSISVERVSTKKGNAKSKKRASKKSKKTKSRKKRKTPAAPKGKKRGVRTVASKISKTKSRCKSKRRRKLSDEVKGIDVVVNHTVRNRVTHSWEHVKGEVVGGGTLQTMIEDRLMAASAEKPEAKEPEKPADDAGHKDERHDHEH